MRAPGVRPRTKADHLLHRGPCDRTNQYVATLIALGFRSYLEVKVLGPLAVGPERPRLGYRDDRGRIGKEAVKERSR